MVLVIKSRYSYASHDTDDPMVSHVKYMPESLERLFDCITSTPEENSIAKKSDLIKLMSSEFDSKLAKTNERITC